MTVKELKAILGRMPEDALVLAPFHYDEIHYISSRIEEHEVVESVHLEERMNEQGFHEEVVYLSGVPEDVPWGNPDEDA